MGLVSMPPDHLCFLCEDGVSYQMCSGCGQHICPGCQVNQDIPLGVHEPIDHIDVDPNEEPDD